MDLKLNILSAVFFTFSIMGFSQGNYNELRKCEKKLYELNKQLDYAKKNQNQNQIKKLENTISDTTKDCNSSNQYDDIDKKMKQKDEKMHERFDDLQEAIKNKEGKEKTIRKKRKYDEAKNDLHKAIINYKKKNMYS